MDPFSDPFVYYGPTGRGGYGYSRYPDEAPYQGNPYHLPSVYSDQTQWGFTPPQIPPSPNLIQEDVFPDIWQQQQPGTPVERPPTTRPRRERQRTRGQPRAPSEAQIMQEPGAPSTQSQGEAVQTEPPVAGRNTAPGTATVHIGQHFDGNHPELAIGEEYIFPSYTRSVRMRIGYDGKPFNAIVADVTVADLKQRLRKGGRGCNRLELRSRAPGDRDFRTEFQDLQLDWRIISQCLNGRNTLYAPTREYELRVHGPVTER